MENRNAELDGIVYAPISGEELARIPEVVTDRKIKTFDPKAYSGDFRHEAWGVPMWIVPDGRILLSRRPHSYVYFAFSVKRREALLEKFGKAAVFPACHESVTDPLSEDEFKYNCCWVEGSIADEVAVDAGLTRTGFVDGLMFVSCPPRVSAAQLGGILDLVDAAKRGWTHFEQAAFDVFDRGEALRSRLYADQDEFFLRFVNDLKGAVEVVG